MCTHFFSATQYGKKRIEEIVLLITDTLYAVLPKLRTGREWMPKEAVRSRLLKLNETHMACVLDTMMENPKRIKKIRA